MSNKRTHDELQNSIKLELESKNIKLAGIYKKSSIPVEAMTEDGYKVMIIMSNFRRGTNPLIFSTKNPYTIYNIKLWLKQNKSHFELLSNDYKGRDCLLEFKCIEDNHKWNKSWHDIKAGAKCPKCSGLILITLEEIKKDIKNKTNGKVEIFNKEYKQEDYISCVCKIDNHKWKAKWNNLKRSIDKDTNGCTKCKNKKAMEGSMSLEEARIKLYLVNDKVEILDDGFINTQTKVMCKCKNKSCNNIWDANWGDLFGKNSGCPDCHNCYYSIRNANKNKESWLKIPSMVYLIKLYNNHEEFYKVGIASNGLKNRYNKGNMPYNYKVFLEIDNISLYEACHIETTIKKLNKKNEYKPSIKFDGKSECFLNLIDYDYKNMRMDNNEIAMNIIHSTEIDIVNKYLSGEIMSKIGVEYNMSTSTIGNIISSKYKIKKATKLILCDGTEIIFKSVKKCSEFYKISGSVLDKILISKGKYKYNFTKGRFNKRLNAINGCMIKTIFLRDGIEIETIE